MKETSKSFLVREEKGMFDKYLNGKGIDIGCGADVLRIKQGSVIPFDKQQGDAQTIEKYKENTFDFVYSSHCLEDLDNINTAAENWIKILKPRGYLYIVVPDWELYEHKVEFPPSKYNPDHKWFFTTKEETNSIKKIINIVSFFKMFYEVRIVECFINNYNYDYSKINEEIDQTRGNACAQIEIILRKK